MRIRLGAVAVAAVVAFAVPAFASGPSIAVTPTTVHRGDAVRVHGAVPGCTPGDYVTLISRAFSRRHEFAGLPAVMARLSGGHRYSLRTVIPASRRPGRYTITGRCGGGNLGVEAFLHVVR